VADHHSGPSHSNSTINFNHSHTTTLQPAGETSAPTQMSYWCWDHSFHNKDGPDFTSSPSHNLPSN